MGIALSPPSLKPASPRISLQQLRDTAPQSFHFPTALTQALARELIVQQRQYQTPMDRFNGPRPPLKTPTPRQLSPVIAARYTLPHGYSEPHPMRCAAQCDPLSAKENLPEPETYAKVASCRHRMVKLMMRPFTFTDECTDNFLGRLRSIFL